jgi:arginyl-tRNA--protein-N-Asp/Glu arginylyltransferase
VKKVKSNLGLNEVEKEQQKCIQNYVNMIFIQHAFSTEDLHALFKSFHSMFHESFEIQKSELTSLFEYMGQNQKLGKEVMEQHVFPLIGIEKPAQLV